MSEVIGKGVIEVSVDGKGVKAGVDDAKRSIKSLGKDMGDSMSAGSARASKSIDNYIKKLQTAANTNGMSSRESELYTLSLKGASKAQLEAADSALKMSEKYQRNIDISNRLRVGFIATAAAAGSLAVAALGAVNSIADGIAKYQDLADKTGETASNMASLQVASDVSGVSLDTVAAASVRLTASLSKTDDESKAVGKGIRALGLDFDQFKTQSPAEQLDSVARAMSGFADGTGKTAAAVAIFGKAGAELLPFLNDLSDQGERQIRLTDSQIKLADEYTKAQARTKSEITALAQQIAVSALPAIQDFSGAIKDTIREVLSLGDQSTDLGRNNGVQTFARSAALEIANLVEYLHNAIGMFAALKGSINVIAADTRSAFNFATSAFSSFMPGDAFKNQATDLNDASAARDQVLKEANARYSALSNGLGLADKLKARFIAADAEAAQRRIEDRGYDPRRKIREDALNGDKAKPEKKDTTAAQEAKAQLAFDLEEIKREQAALANTLGNSEKLISAQRNANLISEGDYYAKKRELLQADISSQEAAAQKEIARLQQENLSGKDKIDNDRKIVAAQANLNKLRENAATNLQVLAIQEKDSLDTIARAYVDARAAAQSYLDVTNRARELELQSMGQGTKTRDFGAAISQIAEKYEQQRQDLQRDNRNGKFAGRQEDFQRELALLNEFQAKSIASYSDYYAKLTEKQGSFALGASEALKNYYDESQNVFKQTEEAVSGAFKSMEDSIIEFAKTGKLSVKGLVDSILTDIARIVIKQQITGPLAGLLGGLLGGGGKSGPSASEMGIFDTFIQGLSGRAIGGPVSAGGMYRVNENGPEMLTAGGKDYLMMGGQGGSVNPTAGGGAPVTVVNNWNVGDIPTMSMLKQAVAGSEARIIGGLRRSRSYAGDASG